VYYEFIDCATGCVRDRFAQKSFGVYMDTEKILLDTFSGKAPDEFARELQAVTDHFDDDVDLKRLTVQLSMLSSVCSGDQPSSIQDVIDKLQNMGERVQFTEVCKLICLLLTIPVSSATAERSFSALRRLKTFTRSTMSAAHLNHVALLHIHQNRTDKLNDDDIARAFVSAVDVRQDTFGKH